MKRILITGSNGYIAQSLWKRIDKTKYKVQGMFREDCDLLNTQAVKWYLRAHEPFDYLIHCATQGGSRLKQDSKDVCFNNILMVENLINNRTYWNVEKREWVHTFDKMLFFSSGAELDRKKSLEPYGLSKRHITNMLKNMDFTTIHRLWNVFDQDQLSTRFIKSSILNYINHKPIVIYEDQPFDFFHADDLFHQVEDWLENKPQFKIVNCTYFNRYYLSEIAKFINTLSNYEVPIIIQKVKAHNEGYTCHSKYCRMPFQGLEERIKQTYQKIKENLQQI